MSVVLPPNPAQFRSIEDWANQMYEWQLANTTIGTVVEPAAVLLAHQTGDERAAVNGILMYNPVTQEPMVASAGAWVPITTLPSYTATQIADITHEANTKNKVAGRAVLDTTNNAIAIANGAGASDTWSRFTVAATVTPA